MFQQTEAGNIGDEIGVPSSMGGDFSAFAAEVAVFTAKAIGEGKFIIQDEVEITKAVDRYRRVGERDEARGLIALGVKMLPPSIERRRKHAALVPFKALLAPAILPDGGCAPAFNDVNQLFKQIALRRCLALGRDLAYVSVTAAPGTKHIYKRARGAFALPQAELDGSEIVDGEALVDWDALLCLPEFVRSLL